MNNILSNDEQNRNALEAADKIGLPEEVSRLRRQYYEQLPTTNQALEAHGHKSSGNLHMQFKWLLWGAGLFGLWRAVELVLRAVHS